MYPSVIFPGNYYAKENTQRWLDGGFTFSELLNANTKRHGKKMFIGGHLTYQEPSYSNEFEEIPHGIVRQIIKKKDGLTLKAEQYRRKSHDIWKIVANEHASGLPDQAKYKQDTWEWTVRREFFDHFMDRATYLLDLAVSQENMKGEKLPSLAEAIAWIEIARINDEMVSKSASVWKNLGLGYMSIVRNKENSIPGMVDIFKGSENSFLADSLKDVWWDRVGDVNEWKSWSTRRWSDTWGSFLKIDKAKEDPSYRNVKSIYDSVMSQK